MGCKSQSPTHTYHLRTEGGAHCVSFWMTTELLKVKSNTKTVSLVRDAKLEQTLKCIHLLSGRVAAEPYLPRRFPVAYKLYIQFKKHSRENVSSFEMLPCLGHDQTKLPPGQTSGKIPLWLASYITWFFKYCFPLWKTSNLMRWDLASNMKFLYRRKYNYIKW